MSYSVKSEREKQILYVNALCGIEKNGTDETYLQGRDRDEDIEKAGVDTGGRGGWAELGD